MAYNYSKEQSIIDYHRLFQLLEKCGKGIKPAERKVAAAAIVEHRMLRSGKYIKVVTQLRTEIISK